MKSSAHIAILWVFCLSISASAAVINIPSDYPTIQQGIEVTSNGDTVLVQPGLYIENINFQGRDITVGSLFLIDGDSSRISQTTINGGGAGSVVSFINSESEAALITGFRLTNGSAEYGAGIYCVASSPRIIANQIDSNFAYSFNGGAGGGIYIQSANPLIEGIIIRGNYVSGPLGGNGGGIYCGSQRPIIRNNLIDGNTGDGYGGGIYCDGSGADIYGNIFTDNIGIFFGGGIYCFQSNLTISNNVFFDNYAEWADGGGILCEESNPFITNCVFFQNTSGSNGGGLYCYHGSNPVVTNCIFYYNEAYDQDEIDFDEISNPYITYCSVHGGWSGEGNIDVDPLFRDPWNGDFYLMSTECGDQDDSPCIDAGSPDLADSLLDCSWGLGTSISDMGVYAGGDSATVSVDDPGRNLPNGLHFSQNYPNPFNASTAISYTLPEQSEIRIEVYSLLGRRITTLYKGDQRAGNHSIVWRADEYPSGVYFARIMAGTLSESIKMLLIK